MVMFSARVALALQAYQTNITSLQEERGKINTSEGALDELNQGFRSKLYPQGLKDKMDTHVRSYILARRTRDRAREILSLLGSTITSITREHVSDYSNETNAGLGAATKWTKLGHQTVDQIKDELITLTTKVETVKNSIAVAMESVSLKLNAALSYSYPHLKIVGTKELWEIWGLNQLPRARAYRDHAIALMEPTMAPAQGNLFAIEEEAVPVDPETDTSKLEYEKLARLLQELKAITANIQSEGPQPNAASSVSSQASADQEAPASVASADPANNPAASQAAAISLAIPAPSLQVTVSSQAASSAAASEPSGPSSQTTKVYTPRSPSTMSTSSEGDTELPPLALPVGSPAPAPAPVLATVLSTKQTGGKQSQAKKYDSAAAAGTTSGSSENSSRKSSGNDGRPRRTNS